MFLKTSQMLFAFFHLLPKLLCSFFLTQMPQPGIELTSVELHQTETFEGRPTNWATATAASSTFKMRAKLFFSQTWNSILRGRSLFLNHYLRLLTLSLNPSVRVRIPAHFNPGRWNLWRIGFAPTAQLRISPFDKFAKFAICKNLKIAPNRAKRFCHQRR